MPYVGKYIVFSAKSYKQGTMLAIISSSYIKKLFIYSIGISCYPLIIGCHFIITIIMVHAGKAMVTHKNAACLNPHMHNNVVAVKQYSSITF